MASMKRSVSIGLIQINSHLGDPQANLEKAECLLSKLATTQAQIVCLPEMFDIGYNLDMLGDRIFDLAQVIPNPTTDRLCQLAKQFQTAIIAGVAEKDPSVAGLIYDTVILINREGNLIGRYRKSHLYPAEHRFFCPGNNLPVFSLDGFKVGVAICFEHAFPQIFTTLALQGAQIVFNPSAVPVGFGYLQNLRTPARAQDNQIFVVAVNHVGVEGDVAYCGGSQIASPLGEVVAMASDIDEVALVEEIDLRLIEDQRRQEPIFRGFRPNLYRANPPKHE